MTKFAINCSFYTNILSMTDREITNCPCKIHINNEFDFEIPLLAAISTFQSVSRDIMTDATTRDFYINIDFGHSLSNTIRETFYDKFINLLYGREVVLDDDEVTILAQIGKSTNNEVLLDPLKSNMHAMESNLTVEECFDTLSTKHAFNFDISDCSKEIKLIAQNFETEKDRIIDIAYDNTYYDVIRAILTNKSLKLKNEDSLLKFVLTLCSISTEYESLFDTVLLEYCTVPTIKEFTHYIDDHLDTSKHNRSFFECIKRRLHEEKLTLKQNYSEGRHETGVIEVTDTDPLNGILRREHQNGNVKLEASSTAGGNVYDLLRADDKAEFYTKNLQSSWIKASLRDEKPFLLKKYMIRGNKCNASGNQLKSWKLEGQRKRDGEWVVLDTHNDEPFDRLVTKVFNVANSEQMIAVKLTQTSTDTRGTNLLDINAFDIFGEYEK